MKDTKKMLKEVAAIGKKIENLAELEINDNHKKQIKSYEKDIRGLVRKIGHNIIDDYVDNFKMIFKEIEYTTITLDLTTNVIRNIFVTSLTAQLLAAPDLLDGWDDVTKPAILENLETHLDESVAKIKMLNDVKE